MVKRASPKVSVQPPPPLTQRPFAGLAELGERSPPAAPFEPQPKPPAAVAGPARAVVRLERKGRGGKEVTVVEQLGLRPRELLAWAKAVKAALGCGGAVEGPDLVLQGDQRSRVAAVLTARGVQKVVLGN